MTWLDCNFHCLTIQKSETFQTLDKTDLIASSQEVIVLLKQGTVVWKETSLAQ